MVQKQGLRARSLRKARERKVSMAEKKEDAAQMPPAPAAPAPNEPKKKSKGRKILIVVLVVFALLVVAGIAGGGGSSEKEDEPFDPSTYQTIDYATVAKNPEDYKGQKLYFAGKVVQVLEQSDHETDLRVATSDNGYDDILYVTLDPDILGGNHIVENQYIGVYGRCTGQISYTSALGAKISIPGLEAVSIDESVKSPQEVQIEAMEALFDGVTWEKVDTSGYGSYEYEATVTNTTENNYSNVSLILGIYDANGTRIGESYATTNSWNAGESVKFDAYLDSNLKDSAASVKVEIQSFSIGSDYYSPDWQ